MWVCRKHKKLNEPAMKKQQVKLKKTGAKLSFVVSSNPPNSPPASPTPCQIENNLPSYIPTALPESIMSFNSQPDVCSAMKPKTVSPKMSRKAKKKVAGESCNFIPVPKGSPMFMFQGVEGKTRSVKWFYDSGCSHLCMKPDIPVKEYDSTLLQRGPFNIGGVGETKIIAKDEYVISVRRVDGRTQHFQGVTMDQITSEFPEINLEAAKDSEVVGHLSFLVVLCKGI